MRRALQALAPVLLLAPLAWLASDELESHDAFCVFCHLDAQQPLHEAKMREFESAPATNLASLHRVAEAEFRCITCHRGASLPNRLRVKVVAARDAMRYALGDFKEPERMRQPLWDEDCVQCHPGYDPKREDAFHAIDDHSLPGFEIRCVQCHQAHVLGGTKDFAFLGGAHVNAVCIQCHEEFRE